MICSLANHSIILEIVFVSSEFLSKLYSSVRLILLILKKVSEFCWNINRVVHNLHIRRRGVRILCNQPRGGGPGGLKIVQKVIK